MVVRAYNDEIKYIEKVTANLYKIKKGFQPNMNVSFNCRDCWVVDLKRIRIHTGQIKSTGLI